MSGFAKGLVRGALRRVGYDIVSYHPAFHTLARRARLLEALDVDGVLDVGANVGQYASQLREIGYRGPIVSFEPVEAAYRELARCAAADGRWSARHCALGAVTETRVIHVSRNLQSSSLLPMLASHVSAVADSAVERDETISVRRLDEMIDEVAPDSRRVFLKMDTQGYERAVVEGAAGCLGRIVAMQAEVSLVPLYAGESGLCEFISFAEQRGFELAGIEPGFADAASGRMLQVDCMFVRRAGHADA
jgi:FkbM family methyltransferase